MPSIGPGSPYRPNQTGISPRFPRRIFGTGAQSTQGPRDANSARNQQYQIELQWDCKTTHDRKEIERIAPKSWVSPKLQTNVPKCSGIGLILQSVRDQSTPKPGQRWHDLLQSCGLWRDCRFEAIPSQSCCNLPRFNFPTNHCQFLTRSNRSCHNRDLRFLQSRGLRLNSGFQAILGQLRRIARILVWGSSAILSTPRNPRNCLFRLFAILPQSRNGILQSCGLWINRISKAILTI